MPFRNFSVGQEPDPPNYYSPVANRYSLPFSARQEPRPPTISLTKFGARVFSCHQLWTEVYGMRLLLRVLSCSLQVEVQTWLISSSR